MPVGVNLTISNAVPAIDTFADTTLFPRSVKALRVTSAESLRPGRDVPAGRFMAFNASLTNCDRVFSVGCVDVVVCANTISGEAKTPTKINNP